MAYLAIARKWRPQTFEDLIGQEHVSKTLQNALILNRVHHAYLFTGARGVGKTTAARLLAKALNCESGPTPKPCNTCTTCCEITQGIAPDVHEIDAASNTGVDSVREIRENTRYLPARGKQKVYIIDEVHMLSTAAFNALLKTLEEPPSHVTFIFATTDSQKVPETILSRCQRFDFRRISIRQTIDHLSKIAKEDNFEISDEGLRLIAREGEGSMRDSQSLLDQILACTTQKKITTSDIVNALGLIDRKMLADCLHSIINNIPSKCLEIIDNVYQHGYDIKQFAKELLEILRNATVLKITQETGKYLHLSKDETQNILEIIKNTSTEVLSRIFTIMTESLDLIAKSEYPKFALEMVLIRLCHIRPSEPSEQLIQRFLSMEATLRNTRLSPQHNFERQTAEKVANERTTLAEKTLAEKKNFFKSSQEVNPIEKDLTEKKITENHKIEKEDLQKTDSIWIKFVETWDKQADTANKPKYSKSARVIKENKEELILSVTNEMQKNNITKELEAPAVKNIFTEFYTHQTKIKIEIRNNIDGLSRSYIEINQAKKDDRQKNLEKEMREHPKIKMAMKIFNAKEDELKIIEK